MQGNVGAASSASVRPNGGTGNEPAGTSAEDDKQEGDEEEMIVIEDDGAGEESQKSKKPSAADSPSKSEVEEHMLTGCAVFRRWCPLCVASQSRGNPH